MNRDELWKIYCDKNPSFLDASKDNITMSREGIKKLFDQTWKFGADDGYSRGYTSGYSTGKPANKYGSNPFEDLFGGSGGPFAKK